MKRAFVAIALLTGAAFAAPMFPKRGILISDGNGNVESVNETNAVENATFSNAVSSVVGPVEFGYRDQTLNVTWTNRVDDGRVYLETAPR